MMPGPNEALIRTGNSTVSIDSIQLFKELTTHVLLSPQKKFIELTADQNKPDQCTV